ncbi:hypothetical protein NQ315_014669 [Exocentrus adspersus]|uniref:CCHC-type domain-containing protein n=1 Tax=Exocentrus adspersus TaxID=1586481 RepID=A0AAV8VR26_9CUCU|nr:hypothetical protein NQ315_014669 [Exocentrus adspersus]
MYPSRSDEAAHRGWELSLSPRSERQSVATRDGDRHPLTIGDDQQGMRSDHNESAAGSVDMVQRSGWQKRTSAFRNMTPAAPGPSRMTNEDVISVFNPEDPNQNIESWCRKVDEVRVMFGWSEKTTIFNALSKLEGLAAVWYKGLRSANYTWEEWKQKLERAFPDQRDYHELLEEMMLRKKKHNETFAQYFYEKQALLNGCKIQGRDAVSCIIGGISESHIRAGAKAAKCQNPEELFNYLRCLNEGGKPVHERRAHHNPLSHSTRRKRAPGDRKPDACFLCNKSGHVRRDCPWGKKDRRESRCFRCHQMGHMADACPKRRRRDNEVLPAEAFVDFGSTCNTIREDAAASLSLTTDPKKASVIRGYGGGVVQTKGMVNFELQIDKVFIPTTAIVVPNHVQQTPLLIGHPVSENQDVAVFKDSETLQLFQKLPNAEVASRDTTKVALWPKKTTLTCRMPIARGWPCAEDTRDAEQVMHAELADLLPLKREEITETGEEIDGTDKQVSRLLREEHG